MNVVIIDNTSQLCLTKDAPWKEVKRYIDKMISRGNGGVISDKCEICFKDIKKRVNCPKRANHTCVECYINIFRSGKGKMTCPFCRFKYGYEMSPVDIESFRKSIRNDTGI